MSAQTGRVGAGVVSQAVRGPANIQQSTHAVASYIHTSSVTSGGLAALIVQRRGVSITVAHYRGSRVDAYWSSTTVIGAVTSSCSAGGEARHSSRGAIMPLDEAVKAKLLKQVLTFTQSGCLWHRSQTRGRLLCAHDCTLVWQIEFYFSESNLPRDKFLLETVSRDPDGFVSLGLLCTFSRMRALLRLADGTKEDKVQPANRVPSALRPRCFALTAYSIVTAFDVSSGAHEVPPCQYRPALLLYRAARLGACEGSTRRCDVTRLCRYMPLSWQLKAEEHRFDASRSRRRCSRSWRRFCGNAPRAW